MSEDKSINKKSYTKRPTTGKSGIEKKVYEKKSFVKKPLIKKPGTPRAEEKQTDSKTEVKKIDPNAPLRLNRYIAVSGICSRREADEMIKLGQVKVNGVVVTEMGLKVNKSDKVELRGKTLSPEKKVYILLNKPKDYVSTVSDPHAEKTVLDLVHHLGNERIYPVGRLDKSTTGVLLLTNDGELTKKLTHPSYNKKKVYHVVLNRAATKAELQQIIVGIELEDGFIQVDSISFVNEDDKREIGVELHSGRNRIVRRIFEHFGFRIEKLDRVYFAGLTKKNVPRGKWRYLSEKEISTLLMGAYE